MTRWLLDALEIEGFRGINNEGDPLVLKFSRDAVNSISAQNGTGKSSIFEALGFALRGTIPKLSELPAAEGGSTYYVNQFHSKKTGTITLTVSPDGGGGGPVRITVTCDQYASRTVAGPAGIDANALLAELNRDFVLLDYKTFQSFIDKKALDRGRVFAGLLGLSRYSDLRQHLQGLANTRAINGHFGVAALDQARINARGLVGRWEAAAAKAFHELTQEQLAEQPDIATAQAKAHAALHQIPVLKPHCTAKPFDGVRVDDCIEAVRVEEGGPDRARLSKLIQDQAAWEEMVADSLSEANRNTLHDLADGRDKALARTAGALMRELYGLSERVLAQEKWSDKAVCPVCDQRADHSILDHVQDRLARYAECETAAEAIAAEWARGNWAGLKRLEEMVREAAEEPLIANTNQNLRNQPLSAAEVDAIWRWRATLLARAQEKLDAVKAERLKLEQRLPQSLVAVTALLEAARRLQQSWRDLAVAQSELLNVTNQQTRFDRIKAFLDHASESFAAAESNASARRLAAVQPVCQDLFVAIMHDPVKPALVKNPGGEELALALAEFWSLKNVSAQALLSESYRNALAVSVYLAAASLYGGAPLFIVLDDITSSFDAGHQVHLMEVIKTKFARPAIPNGLQVILLSHDTLLEKLFNRYVNDGGWSHQRLEGTARTAVLPQSNTANRVRDATVKFLNQGRVEDGALRLRQYLEYKLLEIIGRVRISVPVDFAIDDNKKLAQNAIDAIEQAVQLHQAAGLLTLHPTQVTNMRATMAAVTGNYLSHYATGSTHAFSAASLLGVVKAIDDYAECFTYEDPPGSGTRRYYKSLRR